MPRPRPAIRPDEAARSRPRTATRSSRFAAGRSPVARRPIGGDPAAGIVDPRGLDVARLDRSRHRARETLRREVVAIARNSPQVEVRDLFERFIPEGERIKRLGDVIDRAAILALRGDAARGRRSSPTNPAAQCKTCHKVGDVGETVGPDLTKIGAKYNKPALLDQILEPSKTIDPQYRHLPGGDQGRPGLDRAGGGEEPSDAVVLKDAQGKTIKVPSAEIEQLVPQSRSLMPELLLRDLTAQQVADLLEFLASLR